MASSTSEDQGRRHLGGEGPHLTNMSGPGEGDSLRPARNPHMPGCRCRVTGKGLRNGGRKRQASVLTVAGEGRVEGCGHGERGKKDEWGLSQS